MTEKEKQQFETYDRMMRAVPRMKPRGHGILINAIPETELSIRIRDGTASRYEVFFETFKSIRGKDFNNRLNDYLKESEDTDMSYRNNCHRRAFNAAIQKKDTNNYALLSALYLLTANYELWKCTRDYVVGNTVCFEQITLPNCTEDQYALYCAAKDLYLGTKHMSIADLANSKQIAPQTFAIICNAMTVRRFGIGALKSMENEEAQK